MRGWLTVAAWSLLLGSSVYNMASILITHKLI
jgi:hypothetical protein